MNRSKGEICFYIKSLDKAQSKISVNVLVNEVQAIQNLMYIIGDYLEGYKPRNGGDYPKSVKENCELVITDVQQGSLAVHMGLSQPQQALPIPDLEGTYGERAIKMANSVLGITSSEDLIYPKILALFEGDEHRAYRSLQELDSIWPDDDLPYHIEVNFGEKERIELKPERKPIIKDALVKQPEPSAKTISGRLVEISVERKRQFVLDTPEGRYTCKYPQELEEYVIRRIKNLVSVSGILENNKRIINIESEMAFKPLKYLPLTHVKFDEDNTKELNRAINLEVDFEDNEYILYNADFKLLVTSKDLKDGMDEINNEFMELWSDYVEEDINNLSEGGILFRKKLLSVFNEGI